MEFSPVRNVFAMNLNQRKVNPGKQKNKHLFTPQGEEEKKKKPLTESQMAQNEIFKRGKRNDIYEFGCTEIYCPGAPQTS